MRFSRLIVPYLPCCATSVGVGTDSAVSWCRIVTMTDLSGLIRKISGGGEAGLGKCKGQPAYIPVVT